MKKTLILSKDNKKYFRGDNTRNYTNKFRQVLFKSKDGIKM